MTNIPAAESVPESEPEPDVDESDEGPGYLAILEEEADEDPKASPPVV